MTRNTAYWEQQLAVRGLSMSRGVSARLVPISSFDFEGEGRINPDLLDIVEYKHDHQEQTA